MNHVTNICVLPGIRQAVERVLLTEGVSDLEEALRLIQPMEEVYGRPIFDWRDKVHPISFEKMADVKKAASLSDEEVVAYETLLDTLMYDLAPYLYALRLESDLLQQYGERNGTTEPSLLRLSGKANQANKRLVDSLIYETSSLILSRMLTIRFCEDHELFQARYISNGGIEIFWRFAEHFRLPMQELLRQSYKHAGTIFRSIFDANLLDWAVRRDDEALSDALERAALILSRWDFRTVRGDILSGVYDQYLEVSQRRRLGEVYTRPEVARFMLSAAGWKPQDSVLDPACGTGTFLVEALSQRLEALQSAGAVSAAKGAYDLVIMNPPYIRAERTGTANVGDPYEEVTFKNTDTSIYFIFRALRQWLKPGGTLAFIVPIGVTETAYAGPLRRVLRDYRIKLIADLEGLGKVTFRGVKRATIIMVVENAAPSDEDDIELLQLDPSAYVGDSIDFGRASRNRVKRSAISRLTYLPDNLQSALVKADDQNETGGTPDGAEEDAQQIDQDNGEVTIRDGQTLTTDAPVWLEALRGDEGSSDAILTKFSDGDSEALLAMRNLPRLGDLIRTVFVKRGRGGIQSVLDKQPAQERYAYRPELLFNYGVKLGGASAMKAAGDTDVLPLYKGQNIFPQGLLGEPMGEWSSTARRETTRYIYTYSDHISYDRTFAFRKVSQLPTAVKVSTPVAFQDTVLVCELSELFPLDIWVLSRVIQFYAARVLRGSIIEDFGATWSKRTLILLPIPEDRAETEVETLRSLGQSVLDTDSDLANRYRAIDSLLDTKSFSLGTLIVDQSATAAGVDLRGASEDEVGIIGLREVDHEIHSNDLFFSVKIPNNDLRAFVLFQLERKLEADPETMLSRADLLAMEIPNNLADVADAIRSLEADNLLNSYEDALTALDFQVAKMCGISNEHRDHMISSMKNDPILSKMRPMIAQRGLRVQAYADREGEVLYA